MTRCVSPPAPRITGLARVGLDGAPVTALLVAANVLVYLGQLAVSRDLQLVSGTPSSEPAAAERLTHTVLAFGANYAPFVFGEGRMETLLTSCFVHLSVMHIVFNMAALRQMGAVVERTVGQARVVSMYVASGIVGAATSAVWGWYLTNPERMSAGASGAICGVLGAALVLGVRLQGWGGPIVRAMFTWLALTIGLGLVLGSDNAAHIGGAATGALFAIAWRPGVVYSRIAARLLIGVPMILVLASGLTVAVRDAVDPFATMDVDTRIAYAEAALDRASCRDAALATERAARIAPRSERVRELKRIILTGCRPSP
jgi:rhomboid protease GluP